MCQRSLELHYSLLSTFTCCVSWHRSTFVVLCRSYHLSNVKIIIISAKANHYSLQGPIRKLYFYQFWIIKKFYPGTKFLIRVTLHGDAEWICLQFVSKLRKLWKFGLCSESTNQCLHWVFVMTIPSRVRLRLYSVHSNDENHHWQSFVWSIHRTFVISYWSFWLYNSSSQCLCRKDYGWCGTERANTPKSTDGADQPFDIVSNT